MTPEMDDGAEGGNAGFTGDPNARRFSLPDSLANRYSERNDRALEAEDDEADTDEDDATRSRSKDSSSRTRGNTRRGGSQDTDDEDTEDEDDEWDEDEDDSDDDGQDADADEDDEEEEEPFFDRKEIDRIKDPKARKVAERAYKSMQAAMTRATQRLAEEREKVRSPLAEAQGVTEWYNELLESVRTDEGAERFLLEIAGKRPKAFLAAFDRMQRMEDDPEERTRFEREQRASQRERELAQRERADARRVAEHRGEEISSLTQELVENHGLRSRASVTLVQDRVVDLIRSMRSSAGRPPTDAEVEAVVNRTVRTLKAERDEERRASRQAREKEERKRVKDKATGHRRANPPRGGRGPSGGRREPDEQRRSGGLGSLVRFGLGLEDD